MTRTLVVDFPYFLVLHNILFCQIPRTPLCCSLLSQHSCTDTHPLLKAWVRLTWWWEVKRGGSMSNVIVPAFVSLFVAGSFCYSVAMPQPRQEAVNDRPVIGKWNLLKYWLLCFMLLIFFFFVHFGLCRAESLCVSSPTGILTQMISDKHMKPFGNTYIPSSYVKYIESGGSRVLPIRWVV